MCPSIARIAQSPILPKVPARALYYYSRRGISLIPSLMVVFTVVIEWRYILSVHNTPFQSTPIRGVY